MFLYLIAFVAALLTIFGLPCARNSLRDFSNNGYNQLLEHLLPAFRALLPQRNEEFPVDQETSEIEGGEERFIKADDILAEGEAEVAQDVTKSVDEKPDMHRKSTDSFTFDYRARRYDSKISNRDADVREWSFESDSIKPERPIQMVPQDMWNVLQKTAVPAPEKKNADSLYEALRRLREDDENETFNKTHIIDEATLDKLLEEKSRPLAQEGVNHHRNE